MVLRDWLDVSQQVMSSCVVDEHLSLGVCFTFFLLSPFSLVLLYFIVISVIKLLLFEPEIYLVSISVLLPVPQGEGQGGGREWLGCLVAGGG